MMSGIYTPFLLAQSPFHPRRLTACLTAERRTEASTTLDGAEAVCLCPASSCDASVFHLDIFGERSHDVNHGCA